MKVIKGLIVILFLGLITGCEENSPNDMQKDLNDSGKVIFKITDAPFPSELVAEANITVDWAKLYLAEETDTSGFHIIDLAEDSTFNLLELSNGLTASFGEAIVPAGTYNEIRMHILDAEIVMLDGEVYDLKIPSGSSSGLKIKIKPSLIIEGGEEEEVLLDFDVSRSFVVKGNYNSKNGKNNIKGFNFKPVIRAVPQVTSGQITGMVADTSGVVLENALISLLSGVDTITTALTSEEGYYAIIGISEGIYSLACSIEGYTGQQIDNIEVAAGEVKGQDFSLQPESIENGE